MSSVPCRTSDFSLATAFLSIDGRKLAEVAFDCQKEWGRRVGTAIGTATAALSRTRFARRDSRLRRSWDSPASGGLVGGAAVRRAQTSGTIRYGLRVALDRRLSCRFRTTSSLFGSVLMISLSTSIVLRCNSFRERRDSNSARSYGALPILWRRTSLKELRARLRARRSDSSTLPRHRLSETGYGLIAARRLGYLSEATYLEFEIRVRAVAAPLNGLIKSTKTKRTTAAAIKLGAVTIALLLSLGWF